MRSLLNILGIVLLRSGGGALVKRVRKLSWDADINSAGHMRQAGCRLDVVDAR